MPSIITKIENRSDSQKHPTSLLMGELWSTHFENFTQNRPHYNQALWGPSQYNMLSYQYKDPHYKYKTVSQPSHLQYGNPYTWERRCLYWDGALVIPFPLPCQCFWPCDLCCQPYGFWLTEFMVLLRGKNMSQQSAYNIIIQGLVAENTAQSIQDIARIMIKLRHGNTFDITGLGIITATCVARFLACTSAAFIEQHHQDDAMIWKCFSQYWPFAK